jgi:hypothetical protein
MITPTAGLSFANPPSIIHATGCVNHKLAAIQSKAQAQTDCERIFAGGPAKKSLRVDADYPADSATTTDGDEFKPEI